MILSIHLKWALIPNTRKFTTFLPILISNYVSSFSSVILFFSFRFLCRLAASCVVIVSGDEMAKQGIQIGWPHINHFVLEKTEQGLTLIHYKDTTHYKI